MPLNSGQFAMAVVSARKNAELERAMHWNACQSCLSMSSSRMAMLFNTLAEEVIVAIMCRSGGAAVV